eukprot:gnl/MRDRNA2_/MRDRNA2_70874_c0_seq1.p1 gnl/MRDRNA2_/MRDRNA2_70874_c0~~gnl/MRDRNA2_/MRDRNA2_70874_c0_seq1.p1  ORF type:complete len:611 (+),score=80.52 gnl/MRDRNA2_/MRDRNA2_70874_c0_seq1:74-1906(+)
MLVAGRNLINQQTIATAPIRQVPPAPVTQIPIVNAAKTELPDNVAPNTTVLGRFRLEGSIGKGNFSKCHKAVDMLSGQMVAVKTYKAGCSNAVLRFQRQIKILKELQEPLLGTKWTSKDPRRWNEDLFRTDPRDLFLLLVAHSQPDDPFLCIVTELATYSLYKYLHPSDDSTQAVPLSRNEVQSIAGSLMKAAAGLHAKSLVHLDIKPENVMFFGRSWKLIDVEGCIHAGKGIPSDCPTIAFSPIYCAPEFARAILAGQELIEASCGFDVWSTGMTIAELALGKAPFKDVYEGHKINFGPQHASKLFLKWLAEMTRAPRINTCGDRYLDDLLSGCLLVLDFTRRKELAESLNHDFFKSLPVLLSNPRNSNAMQHVIGFAPPSRPRSYGPSASGNKMPRNSLITLQPTPLQCLTNQAPKCGTPAEHRASTLIQNFFKKVAQKRKMQRQQIRQPQQFQQQRQQVQLAHVPQPKAQVPRPPLQAVAQPMPQPIPLQARQDRASTLIQNFFKKVAQKRKMQQQQVQQPQQFQHRQQVQLAHVPQPKAQVPRPPPKAVAQPMPQPIPLQARQREATPRAFSRSSLGTQRRLEMQQIPFTGRVQPKVCGQQHRFRA